MNLDEYSSVLQQNSSNRIQEELTTIQNTLTNTEVLIKTEDSSSGLNFSPILDQENFRLLGLSIPRMLDSYKFGNFHLLVILALGTTWILDGYEVSVLSSLSTNLTNVFDLDESQIGISGTFYLAGSVSGALIFGYASVKLGRKQLFSVTLSIYFFSVLLITFSFHPVMFYICRYFTGFSIGGEYSAIFSAIDELLPAYLRGRMDLIIDGTWHFGSMIASLSAYFAINHSLLSLNISLRMIFGAGALFIIIVFILRLKIPESPRWLFYKGRIREAIEVMIQIDSECEIRTEMLPNEKVQDYSNSQSNNEHLDKNHQIQLKKFQVDNQVQGDLTLKDIEIVEIFRIMFVKNLSRFLYAYTLLSTQAIYYTSIFYNYGILLQSLWDVPKETSVLYLIPISAASFLGPLILGHYFDTYSRRKMISLCNAITFLLTAILSLNIKFSFLPFALQQCFYFITFIFASPAASSAHLTISEIFPLRIRTQALSIFFALSYGVSIIIPYTFAVLIKSGNRTYIAIAYLLSGFLMLFAGIVAFFFGVDSECKSLEEINDENIVDMKNEE